MPNPDALRRQAEQLRKEADSFERQARDVESRLHSQEQTIKNLEQARQDWQNRLHAVEAQMSATNDPNVTNSLNSQLQNINNKLLDMDRQIQNARYERDKIVH